MGGQRLPIYAKLETLSRHGFPLAAESAVTLLTSSPPPPTRYQVTTLAGCQEQVVRTTNRAPNARHIPVWRGGLRNGRAHRARFHKPTGLAIDAQGYIYVSDTLNHCIRRIAPSGRVSTLVGNGQRGLRDGRGRQARFHNPTGLSLDPVGNLYVVDSGNQLLRIVSPQGEVKTLPTFGEPRGGVAADGLGFVYFSTRLTFGGHPLTVLGRLSAQGEMDLLAIQDQGYAWFAYHTGAEHKPFNPWFQQRPEPLQPFALHSPPGQGSDSPGALTVDHQGRIYTLHQGRLLCISAGQTPQVMVRSLQRGSAWWAGHPTALALDPQGNLYITDAYHHGLWRLGTEGDLQLVAGGGDGFWSEEHLFSQPAGVALDPQGILYVSDSGHRRICRLVPPEQQNAERVRQLPFVPYAYPRQRQALFFAPQRRWSVSEYLARWFRPEPPAHPVPALPVPHEPALRQLVHQGSRSELLAELHGLTRWLKHGVTAIDPAWRPLLADTLAHADIGVRAYLIREVCDLVHSETDALLWIDLLAQHAEPNRLLRRHMVDVLVYLGKAYQLFGVVLPVLVEYVQDPEEDVAQHVFAQLNQLRKQGLESLIDPLIEELAQ